MNTQDLIQQSKARFAQQASREYLAEKYHSKLLVVTQDGLWKADSHTIGILSVLKKEEPVMVDLYQKPVKVNREALLTTLVERYEDVMQQYLEEWKKLEADK